MNKVTEIAIETDCNKPKSATLSYESGEGHDEERLVITGDVELGVVFEALRKIAGAVGSVITAYTRYSIDGEEQTLPRQLLDDSPPLD